MLAKIQKWGNSLGVRLPSKLAKSINLKAGVRVNLTSSANTLIITLKEDPLDDILGKITVKNMHHEHFNIDDNKGNEAW
jgi:antitoxin MazE